jgi:hypothetical protein
MLKKILTRNSLQPQDLQFVLMVGGSTRANAPPTAQIIGVQLLASRFGP